MDHARCDSVTLSMTWTRKNCG